jgi:hypothetical protein
MAGISKASQVMRKFHTLSPVDMRRIGGDLRIAVRHEDFAQAARILVLHIKPVVDKMRIVNEEELPHRLKALSNDLLIRILAEQSVTPAYLARIASEITRSQDKDPRLANLVLYMAVMNKNKQYLSDVMVRINEQNIMLAAETIRAFSTWRLFYRPRHRA